MFHYDERDDSQKQLLDSYWKKKTDTDVAMKYTNADSIASWMNNYEITPDQLSLIQNANPDEYKQRQAKVQEQTDLRIANLATPNDPTQTADLFNTLLQKLNLEPWDPYKIYDNWYDMAERLWVFSDSARLSNYQNQLDANHSKMENIMSRYASSAWGTQSDALVAARLSKALAPYQQIETDLQNSYTALLNGRNSNLAVANQSAQALAMQAAEDQRIFNQRLAGLWFAMSTASYRSPEQQAQLQLQTASIQNDMNLLNQSKLNDLSLYNQRQLNAINLEFQAQQARQQNLLNNELTDLSVSDQQQLRANLNNILSQYYDQYWMMIKRSQQQALNDILQYAKDNNVSVAEALSKNFIEPLQWKAQYQAAVNKTTGYDPYANQQQWQYVQNEDWTVSLKVSWYWEIPASAFKTRSDRIDAYKDVYDYTWGNTVDYVQCLADSIQNWMYWGQCWAFANDVLKASWEWKIFWDSLKQKIDVCNVSKEEWPQPWYAAVFDFWHKSSDWINHGHVAIVTDVHPDWSIDVIESNYNGDWTIRKNTYPAHTVKSSVQWYYKPSNYSTELKPWENSVTTQDWTIVHTQWWDYDDRYSDDFSKILTDSEWKTYTDSDKKTLIKQLWWEENYFNQLYSFKKNRESKWSQQALDTLKTIQKFENAWGRNYWWNLFTAWNTENKRIFDQLQKQLQLEELKKAKENWASFWAMSDSEWDILRDASNSLKWNSLWWFNAELEDIKQALWNAAFGNDNYTKENRQAYKDAHPLASQADKSNNNNWWLQTPFQNSTLFWQNRWYNMNFTSNKN